MLGLSAFRQRIMASRLVVVGLGTVMVTLCVAAGIFLQPGIRARDRLAADLLDQLSAVAPQWEQGVVPTEPELDRALRKMAASTSALPDVQSIAFVDTVTGEFFRLDAERGRIPETLPNPEAWPQLQRDLRVIVPGEAYVIYEPLNIPDHHLALQLTVSGEASTRAETERRTSIIVMAMVLSMLGGTIAMLWLVRSLEESRGELELVLESTQEPLLMVDTGNRIVFANSPARLLLGRGADDPMIGQPLTSVSPNRETTKFFLEVLESDQPVRDEFITVLPGYTQETVFRGHAVPVRTEVGRDLGQLLVLRNVTLEKRLEDRKVNQTIHELKGMLGEANGFIRQVLSRLPQDGESDNQMYLNLSLEKLHHCYVTVATMVRNIKSAFMPEDLDLQPRHEDLGDLVRANVDQFVAMLPKDDDVPSVELDAPSGLPTAYVDREALSRIVMNLLGNAWQHCPNGTIRVSVANAGGFLEVVIADDGAGISPEHLARIFEPHQSFRSGGTGMGLSVCRDFVRAHGGHIWAESPGRGAGATFRFTMPKSRPAIVATDEGVIAHLTQRCNETGYEPVVVTDLLSVVKQIGEVHPLFLLLDLDLQDTITGPSLAYRLKRSDAAGRVPIIAVSRNEAEALAALERYDGLEMDAFLSPDCDANSFGSVVQIVSAYWYVSRAK